MIWGGPNPVFLMWFRKRPKVCGDPWHYQPQWAVTSDCKMDSKHHEYSPLYKPTLKCMPLKWTCDTAVLRSFDYHCLRNSPLGRSFVLWVKKRKLQNGLFRAPKAARDWWLWMPSYMTLDAFRYMTFKPEISFVSYPIAVKTWFSLSHVLNDTVINISVCLVLLG